MQEISNIRVPVDKYKGDQKNHESISDQKKVKSPQQNSDNDTQKNQRLYKQKIFRKQKITKLKKNCNLAKYILRNFLLNFQRFYRLVNQQEQVKKKFYRKIAKIKRKIQNTKDMYQSIGLKHFYYIFNSYDQVLNPKNTKNRPTEDKNQVKNGQPTLHQKQLQEKLSHYARKLLYVFLNQQKKLILCNKRVTCTKQYLLTLKLQCLRARNKQLICRFEYRGK